MMLRIVAPALLLSASSASAEEVWTRQPLGTGLWISDVCRSNETTDKLYCIAYLRGVNAGQAMTTAIGGGKHAYCRDDETVTIEQMRRIVVKFADDHPEHLNEPDEIFVFMALAVAFPCPR